MNDASNIFNKIKFIRKTIEYLKKVYIGTSALPLYNVIVLFFLKIERDEIQSKAGAVAFNFLMAIFPSIIFIFTLIPYFPIENFTDKVFIFLGEIVPADIYDVSYLTISDILSKPRGGLLSFGFVFAIIMASNGMLSLMNAFNRCYHNIGRINIIRHRITATGLTILVGILFLLIIVMLIAGKVILDALVQYDILNNKPIYFIINVSRYVAGIIIYFSTIAIIYKYGPSVPSRWKFISAGSTFASLSSMLVSYGFSIYIENFNNYNKLYGSIGALIALMIWLYVISFVLLLGFQINASIDEVKDNKPKFVGLK